MTLGCRVVQMLQETAGVFISAAARQLGDATVPNTHQLYSTCGMKHGSTAAALVGVQV